MQIVVFLFDASLSVRIPMDSFQSQSVGNAMKGARAGNAMARRMAWVGMGMGTLAEAAVYTSERAQSAILSYPRGRKGALLPARPAARARCLPSALSTSFHTYLRTCLAFASFPARSAPHFGA